MITGAQTSLHGMLVVRRSATLPPTLGSVLIRSRELKSTKEFRDLEAQLLTLLHGQGNVRVS